MKTIDVHGASIPAIGLGTYTLKGDECANLVAKAIETGYRHIDTAKMYDNEHAVGEGLRKSGIDRSDLFVTTKVWWTDIDAKGLIQSARKSVDDLGIGPVDLLLIHWPNPDIALEESIDALNEAISEGLTQHIGVANFPNALFREASVMSANPLVLMKDAEEDEAVRRHEIGDDGDGQRAGDDLHHAPAERAPSDASRVGQNQAEADEK